MAFYLVHTCTRYSSIHLMILFWILSLMFLFTFRPLFVYISTFVPLPRAKGVIGLNISWHMVLIIPCGSMWLTDCESNKGLLQYVTWGHPCMYQQYSSLRTHSGRIPVNRASLGSIVGSNKFITASFDFIKAQINNYIKSHGFAQKQGLFH